MKNYLILKIIFYSALNILLIFGSNSPLLAKSKYWIVMAGPSDCGSNISLSFQNFQDSLSKYNVAIEQKSTWLNAVSSRLKKEEIENLKQYCWIEEIIKINYLHIQSSFAQIGELSYALDQIKANHIIREGLNGKGVKIGIIDGGFLEADIDVSLAEVALNYQYYKDYLDSNRTNPFEGIKRHNDQHGTKVWQMIAGMDSIKQIRYGLAPKAGYYLMRTDHGARESRVEEDYFVVALEEMYQLGVKLVNVSLGYALGFDNPNENHSIEEVDGKSSMVTKAINIAAQEKGMLIVVAAGNEGSDKKWGILSLPADAPFALTVGATLFSDWRKASYSSIAPDWLPFIKPDVVCFSPNGTSYAAPVITGLAACIWQYDSTLTNNEVMDIIRNSAHLAETPNTYLGYGVPDGEKIIDFLKEGKMKINPVQHIIAKNNSINIAYTNEEKIAVAFHKKDRQRVIGQEIIRMNDGYFTVEMPAFAQFTTLSIRDQVIEIDWQP